jgi:hypothetical protein
MQFPAYVPAAVRDFITLQIEGKEGWWKGLAARAVEAEQELSEIKQAIEVRILRNENEYVVGLRRKEAETQKIYSSLIEELECLRRLIHDARMRDAYALLTLEISDDEQWRCFINAAYVAQDNYAEWRNHLKQAEEEKEKIADAANKLAYLIENFSKNGVQGPPEFYSVRDLLRITECDDPSENNRYIWQAVRKDVLGERRKELEPDKQRQLDSPLPEVGERSRRSNSRIPRIRIQFVSSEDVVEHDPLAPLRYGWEKAPRLSALLRTVAKVARDFEPREDGMIGAAVNTRQGSTKTAYIRALAYLLCNARKFALTNRLMRAMAIIANVVINSPDIDITYDDVRKAAASSATSGWKSQDKK